MALCSMHLKKKREKLVVSQVHQNGTFRISLYAPDSYGSNGNKCYMGESIRTVHVIFGAFVLGPFFYSPKPTTLPFDKSTSPFNWSLIQRQYWGYIRPAAHLAIFVSFGLASLWSCLDIEVIVGQSTPTFYLAFQLILF